MTIKGVDACGDVISFKYEPENMILTISADKHVVKRHAQVIKKLLHYPELVSFTGCDAM